jgi:hypothetical protein
MENGHEKSRRPDVTQSVSPVSGFAAKYGEDGNPTLGTTHPDQHASMRDSYMITQNASCCKAQNRSATHAKHRHPSEG